MGDHSVHFFIERYITDSPYSSGSLTDVVSSGYYVGNTYETWCLRPAAMPTITFPSANETYINLYSGSQLDLTQALTGFPIYGNRSGSLNFYMDSGYFDYIEDMTDQLTGRRLCMTLDDDPGYFYVGRFSLNANPSTNGGLNTVTINYTLEPAKYDFEVYSQTFESDGYLTPNTDDHDYTPRMPVCPRVTISDIDGTASLNIHDIRGIIDRTESGLTSGTHTDLYSLCLYYDPSVTKNGENAYIKVEPTNCTAKLTYRPGRL